MGLMDWRSLHNDGPVFRIIIGFLLFCFGLFITIRYIISLFNGVDILFAIITGFALLFFFPFLVFGGFNEMNEGFTELRNKRKGNKKE